MANGFESASNGLSWCSNNVCPNVLTLCTDLLTVCPNALKVCANVQTLGPNVRKACNKTF